MAASILSGLGKDFDLSPCSVPVDSQSTANSATTGLRISMQNCRGIGVLIMKSTSAGTDYLVPVLSECTAYTGGTTTALACITKYWYKTQATVGGDESWVAVTQVAGSTFTTAALQGMYYFEVVADQLSDGYTHILVTIPDSGGGGTQPIAVLYIPFGLKTQRIPSNMPNWLNPGAANV